MELSSAQIRSLAPDAVSFAAGEKIARQNWSATGRSPRALWGEIAGSGKNPYQVRVDLREFAYRCSCPSRKLPCKHVLGLLLRVANAFDGTFDATEPGWIADWLVDRDERAAKKVAKEDKERAAANSPKSPDSDENANGAASADDGETLAAKKAAATARTTARREKRVAEGLARLRLWLADLTRGGLAESERKPVSFWEEEARRLTDAQASGAAALVAGCAEIPGSGRERTARLLGRLGKIALLTEAFARIDRLPDDLAADVRNSLGWSAQKAEVFRSGERVVDRWIALGRRREDGARVETERNWFWGETSRRFLLYLQFAVGRNGYPEAFLPGVVRENAAAFAPGASRFRAFFFDATAPGGSGDASAENDARPILPDDAAETIPEFLDRAAQILARSPWTASVPVLLRDVAVRPFVDATRSGGGDKSGNENGTGGRIGWRAVDAAGRAIPIRGVEEADSWRLVALSSERPIALFGEWRGDFLAPISVWSAGRLAALVGNDIAF